MCTVETYKIVPLLEFMDGDFSSYSALRPPTGALDDQSVDGDSVLDATVTSVGSSLDEASSLRAQLSALNEKVKVLEAQQSSQPAPSGGTVAASEAVDLACPDGDVEPAMAEQAADASGPVSRPSMQTPEESSVPSIAENPTV